MLVKRIMLFVTAIVVMITLLVVRVNAILSGVITFTVIMGVYLLISANRSKKRIDLLNEKCDPKAFLEQTDKQMRITGKNPKIEAYLNVDKVAGLISMGEFQDGKKLLISIDKTKLSVKNGTMLAYTLNLITCLYELGEIAEADDIFERELLNLAMDYVSTPKSPLRGPIKLLIAERAFRLEKYEESQKAFEELLNGKNNRRSHISALYELAKIHEKLGELEKAKEKYRQVSKEGNKLYIAKEAKRKLEEL